MAGHSRGLLKCPKNRDRKKRLGPGIRWKVVLDNLRSGYNTGSIIRNADAFGFSEVVLGGNSPAQANRALKSAAMGAETWVRQSCVKDLGSFIRRQRNRQIIGLEITPLSIPINKFTFSKSGLLIVGNEEKGISPEIRSLCHQFVFIPMTGRKYSLNVSSAFAVAACRIRDYLCKKSTTKEQGAYRPLQKEE
ncbi:TrmH family RNA methyltransferase [Fibrobacterota bacterium]